MPGPPVVPHLMGGQVGGASEGTTAVRLYDAVLAGRAHGGEIGNADGRARVRAGEQVHDVPVDARVIATVPLRLQLVEPVLDVVGAAPASGSGAGSPNG